MSNFDVVMKHILAVVNRYCNVINLMLQARCALNTKGHLVDISSEEENQLIDTLYKLQNPNQGIIY